MLDPIRSCWTSCYTTENLQPTACGFMRVRGWALGHLDRKAAAAWLMSTSQKTHSANFCYNFKHNWWRNSYQGKVFLKDIGRRRKSINFMVSIKKINSSQFQKKNVFHASPNTLTALMNIYLRVSWRKFWASLYCEGDQGDSQSSGEIWEWLQCAESPVKTNFTSTVVPNGFLKTSRTFSKVAEQDYLFLLANRWCVFLNIRFSATSSVPLCCAWNCCVPNHLLIVRSSFRVLLEKYLVKSNFYIYRNSGISWILFSR